MEIMKTYYIAYTSYDHEEYYLWDITDNAKEAIEKFNSENIPSLIEGKQPDITVLNLIQVNLSSDDYNMLYNSLKSGRIDDSVSDYLQELEDSDNYKLIYSCDGSIGSEVVEFYYQSVTDPEDVDDDDFDFEEWSDKLDELEDSNPTKYNRLMKEFVRSLR